MGQKNNDGSIGGQESGESMFTDNTSRRGAIKRILGVMGGAAINVMGGGVLSKTEFQAELDPLLRFIPNPEPTDQSRELDALAPDFGKRLGLLVNDMKSKEGEVEKERVKLMGTCYNQVRDSLLKRQKEVDAEFKKSTAGTTGGERERLRKLYLQITGDIELLAKMPGDYQESLKLDVSKRLTSPGKILETLGGIADKYNLTSLGKGIKIDRKTPSIATSVTKVREMGKELQTIIAKRKSAEIAFQISPGLESFPSVLTRFLGGTDAPKDNLPGEPFTINFVADRNGPVNLEAVSGSPGHYIFGSGENLHKDERFKAENLDIPKGSEIHYKYTGFGKKINVWWKDATGKSTALTEIPDSGILKMDTGAVCLNFAGLGTKLTGGTFILHIKYKK